MTPSPLRWTAGGAAVAALALAGCSGAAEPRGATAPPRRPLAKVPAEQLKPLIGRWAGGGAAKDHFEFRADGSAAWISRKQAPPRTLWTGRVIPDGKDRYRLSWRGGDPAEASHWEVRLTGGGTLVFGGTNKTYTKTTGTKTTGTKTTGPRITRTHRVRS